MESILPFLILVAAIYVILLSTDLFIDIATSLGKKLKLSDYFIGSFIVGISTSLPELFTSLAAVGVDQHQLVVPTIFGTITANIALGLGLGTLALYAFVKSNGQTRVWSREDALAGGYLQFGRKGTPKRFLGLPVAFAMGSVLLTYGIYLGGTFSQWHAMLFLVLYAWFLFWELRRRDKEPATGTAGADSDATRAAKTRKFGRLHVAHQFARYLGAPLLTFVLFAILASYDGSEYFRAMSEDLARYAFLSGLGLIVLFLGYRLYRWRQSNSQVEFAQTVSEALGRAPALFLFVGLVVTVLVTYYSGVAIIESLEWTSVVLGVGDTVLAASALAVGTSLPDIIVAIKVARAGRHMMLFGHILQSNTFDVLLVIGLCGLSGQLFEGRVDGLLDPAGLSILCAALFTAALIPAVWTRSIRRVPGALMVVGFLVFLGLLFR